MKVVVAEDDGLQLQLARKVLTTAGYDVITATNGEDALELALEHNPHLVITDWMMPKMDGVELCRSLRQSKFGRQVYVIILTGQEGDDFLVEAFEAGVDDFVLKPMRANLLLARIRAAQRVIDLQRDIAQEREQSRKITADLATANRKLEEAAHSDVLTSLPNRRYLLERFEQEWAGAIRSGVPLSCILMDIDHFKQINDTCGHDTGDLVLQRVADLLNSTTRKHEVVCRQGGDEFVVVCAGSDETCTANGAERIRKVIEKETAGGCGPFDQPITITVGVAERTAEMSGPSDLLKAADKALYAAKEAGRNQTCTATHARGESCPAPDEQRQEGIGRRPASPLTTDRVQ